MFYRKLMCQAGYSIWGYLIALYANLSTPLRKGKEVVLGPISTTE